MIIQNIGFSICGSGDFEQQEIARRLLAYGIKPSGNKTADRAKLREIELRKAKDSNCILSNLFTVSNQEQEKIQNAKKEKRKELMPEIQPEKFEGSKIKGEQIYLAIKMKKQKNET